jgi:hypothetical protein
MLSRADIDPAGSRLRRTCAGECVERRRALYSECLSFSPARREPERHTKVLFMPLSPDGERVNMIFVIQVFFYIDRATRERHFVDHRPYKEIINILL